ncbi:MAG: hypothetical protein J0L92_31385 [Deltaproteobacteria bacterium]|nr:hypothetical protein [Deltaproteobacteria bacterium]
MDDKQIEQRLAQDDATWNGPRLVALLLGTLAVALTVIFVISSLKSGDYTWHPFAHDNERELPMADW